MKKELFTIAIVVENGNEIQKSTSVGRFTDEQELKEAKAALIAEKHPHFVVVDYETKRQETHRYLRVNYHLSSEPFKGKIPGWVTAKSKKATASNE